MTCVASCRLLRLSSLEHTTQHATYLQSHVSTGAMLSGFRAPSYSCSFTNTPTLYLQFIISAIKEEVRPQVNYEISSESRSPFSLRIQLEAAQPLQLYSPAAQRRNSVLGGANASSA